MWFNRLWSWTTRVIAQPTSPGLEFVLEENQLEWVLLNNRLEYVLEDEDERKET